MTIAHWRKCDFQLHSPRDPNWNGPRPIGLGQTKIGDSSPATAEDVEKERNDWARRFVDQCINRGLGAVAITDHHEMILLPYVQRDVARRQETEEAVDLWVFPGMELTALGGKQCLILFDADLGDDWWRQAQGILGIRHAAQNTSAAQGPPVTQLNCAYPDIGPNLDAVQELKGRYIVLPNVSEGGRHTVLVDAQHADFKRMPYVGGYVDSGQNINSYGRRNAARTSGTVDQWSSRFIYPLPTSDSRTNDFSAMGTNDTWIKLAEPTTEAIRQAFLSHKSRISIAKPRLPALFVANLKVNKSSILTAVDQRLSPELNSIIGGRGSGKSSLIEYLSFALGRSCKDLSRDEYSGNRRLSDLVTDTLTSKNAAVAIEVCQDNAIFTVTRRASSSYQPEITYPDGTTQTLSSKELRALFPAVVYSQGELAELGKQTGSRTPLTDILQFVDPAYKREDEELTRNVESAKAKVREAINKLTKSWALGAELRKLETAKSSLEQRVKALEKTLPKLSAEDQNSVDHFTLVEEFDGKQKQSIKHVKQIMSSLGDISKELTFERDLTSALPEEEIAAISDAYQKFYSLFNIGITDLIKNLGVAKENVFSAQTEWPAVYEASKAARNAALEKLGAHRTVTDQIIRLRQEVGEISEVIADLVARLEALQDPTEELASSKQALIDSNNQRTARIVEWAAEIEGLSSGKIRADVNVVGDISEVFEGVDSVSAKTNSQEASRRAKLNTALQSTNITDLQGRLSSECLALLYWRQLGAVRGEEQPDCATLSSIVGETEKTTRLLIELMDSDRIERISTAVPKPEISLRYVDGDREIAFEKASEGQRAAALLFMLLEQAGGPLLIYQPEGDLDNKIITDLTDKLHAAKGSRQIIFVSHNANIVVNGSSELVSFLDINTDGSRAIQCDGAIDRKDVREAITSTMEGGKKAFTDRHQKYGY